MQPNAAKRNQFVDIMRGIAMLLVVLGHTMTGCTVGSQKTFLFNIVWSLQMPLFILISGYITKYSRLICDKKDLWQYIKRRTIAYMLPWTVWSFLIRGILFGQKNFLNIKDLLWSMDSGYWFLATIWTISMVFGIASFVAERVSKGNMPKKQIVLLLCYLAGMVLLAGIGVLLGLSFFAIKLTLYYMPFYYAGFLYGQFDGKVMASKIGKKMVDGIIALCFVIWLYVILRYSLYELTDSVFSIILRAVTSLAGCIAVCGLCKGIFSDKIGGAGMGRKAFAGSVPHALPASQHDQAEQNPCSLQPSGTDLGVSELYCHSSSHGVDNNGVKQKQNTEICANGKVKSFFSWAGKRSLEIYMIHGLLLNIFKSDAVIQFCSIEGYLLTASNFVLTIGLCAAVISLLKQNIILKKILNIR